MACSPGPFLICDLRPDWNRRPYVTFWRPKNANYAYPLVWAGDYTEAEVMAAGSYYTTVEDGKLIRFPILRSLVEPMSEAPDRGHIDGDTGPVVRNNASTRAALRKLAYTAAISAFAKDMESKPRKPRKLTRLERLTLGRLAQLHVTYPAQRCGFHASSLGASKAAACRRMEADGFVEIERQAENCFRYALTDAGEKAMEGSAA